MNEKNEGIKNHVGMVFGAFFALRESDRVRERRKIRYG